MRAYLASSIAVTCAAALALPLSLATATPAGAGPAAAASASGNVNPAGAGLAGSTQSLPLEPLAPDGAPRGRGSGFAAPAERGLTRREVRPFSLVGVVWDDPRTPLHGSVQVRTRAAAGGAWSDWQDVETHNDEHGADPNTAEGRSAARRGSTAPLWVGDSDGVEIRVHPEYRAAHALPAGLRLELVDPGPETAGEREAEPYEATEAAGPTAATDAGAPAGQDARAHTATDARALAAANAGAHTATDAGAPAGPGARTPAATDARALAAGDARALDRAGSRAAAVTDGTVLPALTRAQTLATVPGTRAVAKAPYIGPRPKIITRKGWGADEKMRERGFVYTKTIKAAFIHHSATGNNYTCRQAPAVLRSIYRYHVKSLGWRDFGYNFAVDKCGNIYEGRAGGVGRAVMGAHTLGFNTNSMGIAVLGTYGGTTPPAAAVSAIARLTAWKLGLYGVNPNGTTYLTSGGGNLYKKGKKVKFHVIAGHRDGFATECPGGRLYNKLGTARSASAKYQGRR
ncbi:N-acetylmuramoyl-L-alanine amidase [Streptomyces sp. NPDC004267]|uniref:peptidoglycan recognition protein family protein n=1 Tax=Streptomyces sp. NPDC004267 TaxID=3364694 RepID=UPI0036C5D058